MAEYILLVADVENSGLLSKSSLEALSAVKLLAESIPTARFAVALVGEKVEAAMDQVAACGADRFLAVEGADFAQSRYGTDALAVETLVKAAQATVVVAPANIRWNRVLPGVTHRLNGRVDTHVTSFTIAAGNLEINRWYYRQRMEATLKRAQRPWVILLESGFLAAWTGASGKAPIEKINPALTDSLRRTSVIGIKAPVSDQQTIRPEAELLFVTGAGWTKKQPDGQTRVPDAEKLILGFIRKTRASLGSSKSLVDLGGEGQAILSFLSHLNQIGQTGATPRHAKGLSTCCHGEEPHTVGWRFISERRAINLDPNCGWARGKADVLYVADAFKVITILNEMLK
jgi:electron transfer flavoprotein alpha subunit